MPQRVLQRLDLRSAIDVDLWNRGRHLRGVRFGRDGQLRLERTLPEEREPAEVWPGRKARTDRICEGIPESFHRVEPVGSLLRHGSEGPQATGSETECYFIGRALEQCSC